MFQLQRVRIGSLLFMARWKPPKEDRVHLEAMLRKRELAKQLSDIVEYGTEEDFVTA
jgi:hypothetical protein